MAKEVKESNKGLEVLVEKRNSQTTSFNVGRIENAIGNAFKQVANLPREAGLPKDCADNVKMLSERVMGVLRQKSLEKEVLGVEEIQDEVVRQLYEGGFKEVAETYANYRKEHTKQRALYELYKTIKRDGKVVSFKPEKITRAIANAFRAVNHDLLAVEHLEEAKKLTDQVVTEIKTQWPEGKEVLIEEIQDLVEKTLMLSRHFDVAKRYVVYREVHRRTRLVKSRAEEAPFDFPDDFEVKKADGTTEKLNVDDLRFNIQSCCDGLSNVSSDVILKESLKNYYDGITPEQISLSNTMATRVLIEKEPNYSYVAARLLLLKLYREALGEEISFGSASISYAEYFPKYIHRAVELELLSPDLLDFDLELLAQKIQARRDFQFKYLGLQTLYDRYFIHWEERRLELPQVFWMRVAMGLARQEGEDKNKRAIEFYDLLSSFRFVSSTPTLFNSGTHHSQLSSCYLSTIEDDLHHIFKVVQDDAMLSKWSGGIGNDWTNVRSMGSRIKGTNGKSQGIIPFLKVANDTAIAVNQGGKRKGAMCAYLETWHLDIEEFLELRKNTGDDRRRTHDMNTANWIPDLFMKRVKENKDWTLFSPHEAPDLHHIYGQEFEKRYEEYEQMAREDKIQNHKTIPAIQLWRKMLTMLFETGHPWITWKDPSNIRSPQDHTGVVHSSNLCTEILLNTSKDETAVCNLGSVNLFVHTTEKGVDHELLKKTVFTAMRMLDNVVDINYYPTIEAKNANLKHRPVGLGVMGFQDALYKRGVNFASNECVEFADESMEAVSYYAILGSIKLAKEKGPYSTFKGSKWDRGLLPLDTLDILEKERGGFMDVDKTSRMDWDIVRKALKEHGIRNSNTMAIAPTATIANIIGVFPTVEPVYKNVYVKSNLSGEFTVVNEFLVDDLKKLGIWDEEMIDDLKYFDGSVQEVGRIPQELKNKYATAFEVDYEWIIDSASRRQKWIDMGQSLNLFVDKPSGKRINDMYMFAWERGLKTTYYLRSLGATRIEKSTLDANRYGDPLGRKEKDEEEETQDADAAEQCRIDNGEDCEACQ